MERLPRASSTTAAPPPSKDLKVDLGVAGGDQQRLTTFRDGTIAFEGRGRTSIWVDSEGEFFGLTDDEMGPLTMIVVLLSKGGRSETAVEGNFGRETFVMVHHSVELLDEIGPHRV